MAEGIQFTCGTCGASIEAWSDGNPYFIDRGGHKHYAYHPDSTEHCTGNDSPHLCLQCGKQFMVDSNAPISACPNCKSTNIADTFDLEDKKCPHCKTGTFSRDPNFYAIS